MWGRSDLKKKRTVEGKSRYLLFPLGIFWSRCSLSLYSVVFKYKGDQGDQGQRDRILSRIFLVPKIEPS